MTDAPTGLLFVDPHAVQTTYRICLCADPGEGKTLAAATAPGPLLVLNADRPSAWEVARRRNPDKEIRETRYVDHGSLEELFPYLASPEGADVATLVIDPWSNIYDQLCATAPKKLDTRDGQQKPDYEMVNSKLLGFITAVRRFDVHVVLIAHLKENEGKKADGKTYPRLGGMGLIRKVMAEMDIVAWVARTTPEDGEPVWFAQIQPTESFAGKDGTDALGARRVADLTRWVELARAANAVRPVDTDLPWSPATAANTPDDAASLADPDALPAAAVTAAGEPPALPSTTQVDAEEARIAAEVAADIAADPDHDWPLYAALLASGGKAGATALTLGCEPSDVTARIVAAKRFNDVSTLADLLERIRTLTPPITRKENADA